MKVKDLIARLSHFDSELTVVLDDDWSTAIADVEQLDNSYLEDDPTTGRLKKVKSTKVVLTTHMRMEKRDDD